MYFLKFNYPIIFGCSGHEGFLWLSAAQASVVAQGLNCLMACSIFWDQGWNPGPLNWQADSQPLDHQRSPI